MDRMVSYLMKIPKTVDQKILLNIIMLYYTTVMYRVFTPQLTIFW
jgi:hypothetical protein